MTEGAKIHSYKTQTIWTGNQGSGTSHYRAYSRDHIISVPGKPPIMGSSDAAFRGAADRLNPEELMVSALSSCHMLWYLHLCAESGVVVLSYEDHATGWMEELQHGGGRFTLVRLEPMVRISSPDMLQKAEMLHEKAHEMCFIANSVNFEVTCLPKMVVPPFLP